MKFNLKNTTLAFALIFLTIYLGYYTLQSEFSKILLGYAPFFAIYTLIYKKIKNQNTIWFFVGIGIFLRFLLLFSYPNLSDDLYRFIWDGRLLINGFNPFDHLPKYYIENNIIIEGITPDLYAKLNSPEYFTIYPPVAQLTFATAVWLFPNSIWGSAIVMKLFLFLFETGSILLIIKLLQKFQLPSKNVLIYTLNPLIIIEICGNLHFEGAMIFFLLLSIWLLVHAADLLNLNQKNIRNVTTKKQFALGEKNRFTKPWRLSKLAIFSAIAFALSVASKLLPLMFLPFFIKRLGWKRSISYFFTIGITLAILFLPLVNGVFLENFGNSLNLYFQKFEFNASVYYVARWIGYQQTGWNLIAVLGPLLAICTPILIFLMAKREKVEHSSPARQGEHLNIWQTLFTKLLFAICIYLLFTTTIHPWYVALPVVLCGFTSFRFPMIWSGLIMLTYINYSYPTYYENLCVVGIEYAFLGLFLIYELILTHKFPQVRYLRR